MASLTATTLALVFACVSATLTVGDDSTGVRSLAVDAADGAADQARLFVRFDFYRNAGCSDFVTTESRDREYTVRCIGCSCPC